MNGSIRRRGKRSWELRIDLGHDTQGKRLRKWVHVRGTKADADKRLRELLAATDRGIPLTTDKVTVGEWFDRWLAEYAKPNTRQRSYERYLGAVKKHIMPHVGHIQLRKLAASDLQALEARLLADGLSASGVELVHNIISGALKYAVRMEVLWRNVAKSVTPPKVTRQEISPPDIEGVRRVLDLAKEQLHPLHPCLHIVAYTGIRRGEALGLRWQDVDLGAGTISIVQTIGRANTGLITQPPKTDSGRRRIDLDPGTVAVLRAHRTKQLEHRLRLGGAYEDNDLVFADPLGRPLNPMALTRAFQSLARKVGINDVRFHDLRHFHASVMLQQGQNPVLVSKRLGHAKVTTTLDIYGHVIGGWQRDAATAFAKAMNGG